MQIWLHQLTPGAMNPDIGHNFQVSLPMTGGFDIHMKLRMRTISEETLKFNDEINRA